MVWLVMKSWHCGPIPKLEWFTSVLKEALRLGMVPVLQDYTMTEIIEPVVSQIRKTRYILHPMLVCASIQNLHINLKGVTMKAMVCLKPFPSMFTYQEIRSL